MCSPLFVTWNKKAKDGEYHLRGCIGNFSEVPLRTGLAEYAVISGTEDRRFDPIKKSDLNRLQCAVSLLTNFEVAKDVFDWTIGVHGIRISFTINGRPYSATYLPEVCVEQGWTKEECLDSLYRKAGLREPVSKEILSHTKLERYQSSKTKLSFEEYDKNRANYVPYANSGN
eukprot:ANDGO_01198.mRNA.1 Uncharacterized protein CG5902